MPTRHRGPRPRQDLSGARARPASGRSTASTLSVARGTIFALVGPNGAGKTTTVKILTTLATPDEGTATVEGIDVLAGPARARRVIGVVGAALRAPTRRPPAGRTWSSRATSTASATTAARRRADELLERFRLTEAAGRFVRTYSGGMQRRLDVALGLVHRPQVLFLDEPTTGLDPESRAAMWDEITRLADRRPGDRPAHHALPGRGRPARRPAGHRRPGPGRRRGRAGPAQAGARRHVARRGVPALRGPPVQRCARG